MRYLFNNNYYDIIITKKNNKNTYIRVKEDLKIYVTTNYFDTNKHIESLINSNKEYIDKMLTKYINKNNKITILGNTVDVIKLNTIKEAELDLDKFYIKNDFDKEIKNYAYKIFKERLDLIYNKFEEKIPYPKLKIRKMTTRWGVCNKRDVSVTLNLNLIHLSYRYIDYVIVHELSHLVYFDHSKDFWNLVSKYVSDYKLIRKEMKDD